MITISLTLIATTVEYGTGVFQETKVRKHKKAILGTLSLLRWGN